MIIKIDAFLLALFVFLLFFAQCKCIADTGIDVKCKKLHRLCC